MSAFSKEDISSSVADSKMLDDIYKEQLATLRKWSFQTISAEDVKLCNKWIGIFNKTTANERMARDCLCSLMMTQLSEFGYLTMPFTNKCNLKTDLNEILRQLDATTSSKSVPSQEKLAEKPLSDKEQKKHKQIIDWLQNVNQMPNPEQSNETPLPNEKIDKDLSSKDADLQQQLKELQEQILANEVEYEKLRESAIHSVLQEDEYKQENEKQLNLLPKSIQKTLKNLFDDAAANKHLFLTFPLNFFQNIFIDFTSNAEFYAEIQKLDKTFDEWLSKRLNRKIQNRNKIIFSAMNAKYDKVVTKWSKIAEDKNKVLACAEEIKTKLIKMKICTAVREVLMQASEQPEMKVEDLMKLFENKYENIIKT